jgi:hypothetical protein
MDNIRTHPVLPVPLVLVATRVRTIYVTMEAEIPMLWVSTFNLLQNVLKGIVSKLTIKF